jgi:hypothetical protein
MEAPSLSSASPSGALLIQRKPRQTWSLADGVIWTDTAREAVGAYRQYANVPRLGTDAANSQWIVGEPAVLKNRWLPVEAAATVGRPRKTAAKVAIRLIA